MTIGAARSRPPGHLRACASPSPASAHAGGLAGRVGLAVCLVLLLGVAGLTYPVGGTVGGLAGDLLRFLSLLGLLPRRGEVAPPQEPAGAALQAGELVAGLLEATGRRSEALFWTSPCWQDTSDERRVSRCPTNRRGPDGSSPLTGGWSCQVDVLRLGRTCRPGAVQTPPGRGAAASADPPHPRPLRRRLRRTAYHCRAASAWRHFQAFVEGRPMQAVVSGWPFDRID